MRSIVNISLPAEMTKDIEREVRRLKFGSKSEFMRHLIREWVSARQVMSDVAQSEREHRAGKSKKLTSPDELWR